MRAIDADVLKEEISKAFLREMDIKYVLDIIDSVPPIFTENANKEMERPQSRWIFDMKGYFYCELCKKFPQDQITATDFCPKCGADMRGGWNKKVEKSNMDT